MLRELSTGLLLGTALGCVGLVPALLFAAVTTRGSGNPDHGAVGRHLRNINRQPAAGLLQTPWLGSALMSKPFVAGINDICAILLYVNVARVLL